MLPKNLMQRWTNCFNWITPNRVISYYDESEASYLMFRAVQEWSGQLGYTKSASRPQDISTEMWNATRAKANSYLGVIL